jgi:hypothetical protein
MEPKDYKNRTYLSAIEAAKFLGFSNKSTLKKREEKYYEIILKRENRQNKEAAKIKDEICSELESLLLYMNWEEVK